MSGKFLLVRCVLELACSPQKRNTDSEIVKTKPSGLQKENQERPLRILSVADGERMILSRR